MRLEEDKEETSLRVVNAMKIKKEWDEFVYNHPKANIFQTSYMAEVFERTKKIEPITLVVIDEETDEILASLLSCVMKQTNILSSFTSWARIRGGPLFLDNEKGIAAVSLLIQSYDSIIRKKVLYTDIWNLGNTQQLSMPIENNGYIYEDLLNFLIDLTKSKEELWEGLNRDKRRGIKKAKELNIAIEICIKKEEIPICYDLLQETYKNAKIPLADISLFESTFDILVSKHNAVFLFAKYDNKCIATQVALIYKDTIYAWYTGVIREYLSYHPGDLLIWHLLEWGAENGYSMFDFGGAGNPKKEYGVREYKKQFGGQLVNFGRYKKIHSPKKLWLAEKGFEVWRRLKR